MSNSHYVKLVEAAEMLKKEVGFFSDNSVEDEDYVGDVGREIWILNLSLEYFYSKGIYPFGTTDCAIDFSDNWLKMCVADYLDENKALKKRYKKRVRSVCKKGQFLEPREQEAFDLANKLWGSQSGCGREEHQQDHMLVEETHGNDKEVEEEDQEEDSIKEDPEEEPKEEDQDTSTKFPVLEETFKLDTNIPDEQIIPVTSHTDIKNALAAALGPEKEKKWMIHVQELKILQHKLTLVQQDITQLLAKIDQ